VQGPSKQGEKEGQEESKLNSVPRKGGSKVLRGVQKPPIIWGKVKEKRKKLVPTESRRKNRNEPRKTARKTGKNMEGGSISRKRKTLKLGRGNEREEVVQSTWEVHG